MVGWLRPVRLAQNATTAGWWPRDGQSTVQKWDALIARSALVSSPEARDEIMKWVGRSDIPGSPAERYRAVAVALASGTEPDENLRQRLSQLEGMVGELEARVTGAESTYGTLSAPNGAEGMSGRRSTMICITGSVALLGLIVLPLLID